MKITGKCNLCGECCKNLIIIHNGEAIADIETFNQIKKNNEFYQNLTFKSICSSGFARFSCNYLIDNRCSIYKNRPDECRSYPTVAMFKHGGQLLQSCGYKIGARKPFSYFLKNNM
ncbi:MAG: YkgJ family cysteine cluster protein [Candidatus Cloacimonadales bacterium]|jgi:Fe-S-cluster containining protein|nr:YkgJ family cysteine cluster protein [Candidatus Cloacimonadota bacterium]MDD2651347.1 YkgJ family cysteine cluster protein [Candidatus Cloacimonadota bacterium]MDD3501493.1 YkgJ family cysteine cluster protein [Candidatus Cloacimonadota bacterium]MDX9977125.1 YkgJ family cysteine cluster protein [Candidatus Cloacimonadales bacterium]